MMTDQQILPCKGRGTMRSMVEGPARGDADIEVEGVELEHVVKRVDKKPFSGSSAKCTSCWRECDCRYSDFGPCSSCTDALLCAR